MSWSVTATGTSDVIGKAFDAQREQSASWGMIEPEQRDIDKARDFAMAIADAHGPVNVSANGHWVVYGPDDERNVLGQISVSISPASQPTQ